MTTTIRTAILINATPDKVWRVLTDFPSHPQWNPLFTSIEGSGTPGQPLDIKFRQGIRLRPLVTMARKGETFEWLGKLLFGGLFDGRHRFELHEEGAQTRLVHSESFCGLLVPLLNKLLDDTERGFVAFNDAIKRRVEGQDEWQEKLD